MASFKAIFPVLQELFAKNHRGALCPPPPSAARVKPRRGGCENCVHRKMTISPPPNISASKRARIIDNEGWKSQQAPPAQIACRPFYHYVPLLAAPAERASGVPYGWSAVVNNRYGSAP